MVKRETNSRGVDYVLNSLAEEKQLASVSCLARGGHFLEIGKFDLANDSPLQLALMRKNCSFHGVMLDLLLKLDVACYSQLWCLIAGLIQEDVIKPLPRVVFKEKIGRAHV